MKKSKNRKNIKIKLKNRMNRVQKLPKMDLRQKEAQKSKKKSKKKYKKKSLNLSN